MAKPENDTPNIFSGLLNNVHINSITSTNTTHEVFIDSDIEEPSKYRELISLLINAPASDKIHLMINSPGGNLDTACAIINGIMVSQAEVTAFLMGACHSAASMITMYCHNVHVFDTAYIMIHTGSFGSSGNTTTIKAHTDFTINQIEKLLDDAYEGFLNKDELQQVKNGIEIWFEASDIRERLKTRFDVLEAKRKEVERQLKEEEESAQVKEDKTPLEMIDDTINELNII